MPPLSSLLAQTMTKSPAESVATAGDWRQEALL